MGTINYGSNEIINLGININIITGDEVTFLHDIIQYFLNDYDFYFYHVVIKPGHYEGFYLDIENNFFYYDDYLEKQDAQKELTQLKEFLNRCVDNGLVAYNPGWCTGYYDMKETKAKIKEAIKEERQNIKDRPTWVQYTKEAF